MPGLISFFKMVLWLITLETMDCSSRHLSVLTRGKQNDWMITSTGRIEKIVSELPRLACCLQCSEINVTWPLLILSHKKSHINMKKREGEGGEFDQSLLYTCIEISQEYSPNCTISMNQKGRTK